MTSWYKELIQLTTNAVRLILGDIDGAMGDKGEVETNGDMLGL